MFSKFLSGLSTSSSIKISILLAFSGSFWLSIFTKLFGDDISLGDLFDEIKDA